MRASDEFSSMAGALPSGDSVYHDEIAELSAELSIVGERVLSKAAEETKQSYTPRLLNALIDWKNNPNSLIMETRTRSGRVVKKPEIYTPDEVVEDDFSESDYDSNDDCSDVESIRTDDESGQEDEDDLDGFIVPDDEDCSSEEDD